MGLSHLGKRGFILEVSSQSTSRMLKHSIPTAMDKPAKDTKNGEKSTEAPLPKIPKLGDKERRAQSETRREKTDEMASVKSATSVPDLSREMFPMLKSLFTEALASARKDGQQEKPAVTMVEVTKNHGAQDHIGYKSPLQDVHKSRPPMPAYSQSAPNTPGGNLLRTKAMAKTYDGMDPNWDWTQTVEDTYEGGTCIEEDEYLDGYDYDPNLYWYNDPDDPFEAYQDETFNHIASQQALLQDMVTMQPEADLSPALMNIKNTLKTAGEIVDIQPVIQTPTPQATDTEAKSAEFLRAALGELAEQKGEKLNEDVANLVKSIWAQPRNPEKVKTLSSTYLIPENLDGVQRTDLNEEVVGNLSRPLVNRDFRLRSVQASITRAVVPITRAIEQICDTSKDIPREGAFQMMYDSITLLGNASALINNVRREFIKTKVSGKFKNLCGSRNYSNTSKYLFGEDLSDKITTQKTGARLMQGVMTSRRPHFQGNENRGAFRGRGRTRPFGRGHFGSQQQSDSTYGRSVSFEHPVQYDLFNNTKGQCNDWEKLNFANEKFSNNQLEDWEDLNDLNNDFWDEYSEDVPLGYHDFGMPRNALFDMYSQHIKCDYNHNVPIECYREDQREPPTQEGLQGKSQGVSRPGLSTIPEEQEAGIEQVNMSPIYTVNLNWWPYFKAGRISERIYSWKQITRDKFIIADVAGVKLEFVETPWQNEPIPELRFSQTESNIVRKEVYNLQKKGVVIPVQHQEGEFISNIFLRQKKDKDKFRMIVNLTQLNNFVIYRHFKMESLDAALKMIEQGAWFGSLDFTDAYYSFKIHEDFRKFLRFSVDGNLMEMVGLPNGLGQAPRVFTRTLKVPLSVLRRDYNISITGYIDDTFLTNTNPNLLIQQLGQAAELFQDLGFMISTEKSVIKPTQEIEYLGFILNSKFMTISLPERKVQKIQKAVKKLMKKQRPTIRLVSSILGILEATHPANRFCRLFTKQTLIARNNALRDNKGDYEAKMDMSPKILEELQWWVENTHLLHENIVPGNPTWELRTDSSMDGWGFFNPNTGLSGGGRWSESEQENHINYLEMKAIWLSLQTSCKEPPGTHIKVLTDNSTAVCTITKQGSSKSVMCHEMARNIWFWALEKNIWITIAHIPGVENIEADWESRNFHDDTEWELSAEIFQIICKKFGTPQMDLFASRLNHKLDKYVAWKPDPNAWEIDAYTFSWEGMYAYCFPPFCQIPRIIQKALADGAQLLLVVPLFYTRAWYTIWKKHISKEIYSFKMTNENVFLSFRRNKVHPMANKLEFAVGILSRQTC